MCFSYNYYFLFIPDAQPAVFRFVVFPLLFPFIVLLLLPDELEFDEPPEVLVVVEELLLILQSKYLNRYG